MKKTNLALVMSLVMAGTMVLGACSSGSAAPAAEKAADKTAGDASGQAAGNAGDQAAGNAAGQSDGTGAESPGQDGTGGSAGGKKKIGVVEINFTNPFYIGWKEAAEEAAEELGYEITVQSAENSVENEISQIENFIELGVDCIIADPQDAGALVDVFKKAADAGIVVIGLNSPVDTGGATYNCIIDHYTGFKGVTYAVAEAMGQKGSVCLIQGQVGHEASDSREKGFNDALKQYKDIQVLDVQPCDWDVSKGVSIIENWMVKYPDVNGILCMTDGVTPSLVDAVETQGRLDRTVLAGNDAEMECLELMTEGKLTADYLISSYRDGWHAIAYADAIMRGLDVERDAVLPGYVVCSEELARKVKAAGFTEMECITPEEAIRLSRNYADEFRGYFD